MTHNTTAMRRNILLFHIFLVCRDPLFWAPILISYVHHVGHMEFAAIYVMEAIVVLGLVFLEIPTGALADLIGMKKTIVIGYSLSIIGLIFFLCMYNPFTVWMSNIVWSVGAVLISSADTSLLFESMKKIKEESHFKKVMGKAFSGHLLVTAIGSFASGFLYKINPRLPIALSLPVMVVALIATIGMKEPNGRGTYVIKDQLRLIKDSVTFVWKSDKLVWAIAFMMLISGVSKVWFFYV
ncbi:MAG: MFS transporter [bacterium]